MKRTPSRAGWQQICKSDELIILTGVDQVYENYGTESQTPISAMTVAQAQELMTQGQFEPGTMLPKIEAAISYLGANPQGRVLITSMDALKDALREKMEPQLLHKQEILQKAVEITPAIHCLFIFL